MIPMLVGSRFRRTRVATPRRSKVWVGARFSTALNLAPGATSFATLIDESLIETQGKPTLARCRGSWIAMNDASAAAATGLMTVAAGITVVSTKAAQAGIASLPLPLSNIEYPWLWWDATYVGIERETAGVQSAGQHVRMIDSKAMRKLPPASTLIIVFEASAVLHGNPDGVISFDLRMLLMPS